MTRNYKINGPVLMRVIGGAHMSGGPIAELSELGLTEESVTVTPFFAHKNVNIDDFGPDIPVDVQAMLASVQVQGSLIHYDDTVLDLCMAEGMGIHADGVDRFAGVMPSAGTPLGGGRQMLSSGCHFVRVSLTSPILDRPWRFRTCYFAGNAVQIPLGTKTSIVPITFTAIPYRPIPSNRGEIRSSGVVLWDREEEDE